MKVKKIIKFIANKFLVTFLLVGILFQSIAPTIVLAVNWQDGDLVEIGGTPVINGTTFEYEHGDVTITKNGEAVSTTSFAVADGNEIVITLTPDEEYTAYLHDDNNDYNVNLENNTTYSFTINQAREDTTLSFTPMFSNSQPEPTMDAMKFDFTFNGQSFTNVSVGDIVAVPENFNLDSVTEFYVTKIAIEGGRTYTYAADEYSYDLLNDENKHIFETHFNKISDNLANLRMEAHAGNILEEDIAQGKTREDYFGFYITGMFFVKSGFKGVEISTEIMPDNYDFTVWNGADLSTTTKDKPGKVTAYYGESTIRLQSSIASGIAEIKLVDGSEIPASALNINSDTGEITILSNYYNEIPLQIELEDGTVGYITINRIGIFVGIVDAEQDTFYHGAAAIVSGNLNVDTDKTRIAAVFYHEDTTTFEDYDLIANLTYKDGSTKTVIATGVGDVRNSNGNIIGSDYVLWKGTSAEDTPVKVSVTAVEKGAISSETEFGGATFGSGAGVVWNRK